MEMKLLMSPLFTSSIFVILHFNVYLQMLEVVVLCLHDMLLIINFIDYFFENFRTIWTSCSCLCISLMRERFDFLEIWLFFYFYFIFPMVSLYLIEYLSSCTSYLIYCISVLTNENLNIYLMMAAVC